MVDFSHTSLQDLRLEIIPLAERVKECHFISGAHLSNADDKCRPCFRVEVVAREKDGSMNKD